MATISIQRFLVEISLAIRKQTFITTQACEISRSVISQSALNTCLSVPRRYILALGSHRLSQGLKLVKLRAFLIVFVMTMSVEDHERQLNCL